MKTPMMPMMYDDYSARQRNDWAMQQNNRELDDLWIEKCAIPFAIEWLSEHNFNNFKNMEFYNLWKVRNVYPYEYGIDRKHIDPHRKFVFLDPEAHPNVFFKTLMDILCSDFICYEGSILGSIHKINNCRYSIGVFDNPEGVSLTYQMVSKSHGFFKPFLDVVLTNCLFYNFVGHPTFIDSLYSFYTSLYDVTNRSSVELENEYDTVYSLRQNHVKNTRTSFLM